MRDSYLLTVKCPDRTGIVAAISTFVFEHGGWITEAHHHSDEASGVFFTRQEVRADSLPFAASRGARRIQHRNSLRDLESPGR